MRKYSHPMTIASLITVLCLSLAGSQVSAAPLSAGPVGTAFTYQGQLKDGSGNPITNTCDFQFGLYDALTSGSQIGSTQTVTGLTVTNGYFTSSLDFGAGAFGGDARWLEIAVRCPAGGGGYTTLTPRQPLTPAPYSLYALNAGTAANATNATNATNAANAALLNGLPSSTFQQHYQNLLVVAQSGGDYTTITQALNSITTAGPTNTFLICVAPGTYNETVTMKPYVDIEGSGELTTTITYTGTASYTGTVLGASNAELRFLTVENTGGAAYAIAIYNSSASPRLTHITATASGGSNNFGVYNYSSSSPAMTDVTATASGGTENWGVWNYNSSSPTMTNVTATASGGTYSYGVQNTTSSPTMTNVTATATGAATNNYGVWNTTSSSPTMMNVTATASGGTNNYGVENDSSSSPTMANVTASASGAATNNYGVYNYSSAPTMTNVTATASGAATSNYGVYNYSSSPTMMNVTATASGAATSNYGVYNTTSSSPTIQSSVITASGGATSTSEGIANISFGGPICTVQVNNSRITGAYSIAVLGDWNIYVGASQLSGAALGPGFTCVSSYNAAYLPLNSTCTYP